MGLVFGVINFSLFSPIVALITLVPSPPRVLLFSLSIVILRKSMSCVFFGIEVLYFLRLLIYSATMGRSRI